ncbi:MAG: hypothetical protein CVU78_03135 [Elusimicrobia bacterium HGW-Elusimicrobia-2]|nr:MAG: hypothetical protein CVU78_03135 [Elusimicrobia bacterium HGW-Elusimicrobia-2]
MINTIDFTTLRNHLSDVLKEVSGKKDFILVTRRQKPESALVNLDFFEDLLAMASKDYLKSIKEARGDYKNGRVYTHGDVFGKIE